MAMRYQYSNEFPELGKGRWRMAATAASALSLLQLVRLAWASWAWSPARQRWGAGRLAGLLQRHRLLGCYR